ncbi:hypothetical protein [Rhodococcoides fascians]|uniref:hypothetical protein n=1 Tax=Rhodococcoides fascians TaxID=1828 RepID=UPI00055D866D|nr:hypothetical protein [Rhodococcus fascians]
MNRKERRAKEAQQALVQRKLAAALEDAWQRLPQERQERLAGKGTEIEVGELYIVASVAGEPYAYIDRLWLHSRDDEPPKVETIAATPDYLA